MVKHLISVAVASVLSCDISKPANSSGNFEYTARSMNAPGNSMSVGIQIK